MVSWTSDLCSRQSGCKDITWVVQQSVASGWHVPFLHLRSKPPSGHHPHSCKTRQIPLCSKGELGLNWGNTMDWDIFCPSHKYQPFCMQGFLPPGPRFIFCTRSVPSEYVEWPWELPTHLTKSAPVHNSSYIWAAGPHPWASPQSNK